MADVLHVKPTESSAPHAETFDLDAKYTTEEGRIFLTGIQALVRVPLDHIRADRKAGRTTMGYISGYPGSPLGGFDSELIARRKLLDAHGVVHQSGLNEELGATAVMGSQEAAKFGKLKGDSVIGIWYGKAPGLDRSGDALRHAPYFAPTYGNGALAYVGDDPGDKSSTLPSGSIQTMANLCMAVLYPGNPQEVLDFGRHGLMLSRECGIWSGIKVDTAIADGSGTAEVSPDRIRAELEAVKEIIGRAPAFMGRSAMHPMVSAEREIHDYRLEAARAYGALNGLNAVTHDAPDATLGIMAPGHTYYALIEALHTIGLGEAELRRFGIKIMRIGMVYPLDNDAVRGFARGLDELLVVEEKRPYIEELTRAALYGMTEGPRLVTGKRDASGELLVPSFGWLDADALVEPLVRRITERVDSSQLRMPEPPSRQRISLPVIPRTPYFCSGCPHNTSLKVPDDSKVSGGIGCHSMITFLDRERSGDFMGFTQMGGEGVHWAGIAPFVDTDHIFQNLGDGTYFHSGQLCVQAAVAAGVNITYKLLYNRAVAMTGGQDVVGELEVPEMVRVLMLQGVKHIIITTEDRGRYRGVKLPAGVDVWDRERIVEAQERLREIQGVTVLIHDQQCAAEARRLRKRGQLPEPATTVVIAERVCEGCGDCGVYSNCLSLQPIDTEFGEKTSIDQTSCNKDYSCLHGDCPSFITLVPRKDTKLSRALGRAAATRTEPSRPETLGNDIPEPTPVVPVDDFTVRMPGIGGTGVVTVAQVLGTAAMLDGRFVNSLDQTGLSQKGGAVISDVRITTSPVEGANKLAAGMLDVYLVFDLVGALSPSNLDAASASRTVAVVSTTKSATGLMIGRPTMHQPSEAAMRGVIDGVTRAEHNVYFDAARVTRELFGRSTSANMLALGVAYQAGALPISASAIEQAIELNGVAVETNMQAFRWGRMLIADPDRLHAASTRTTSAQHAADPRVGRLIGDLAEGELGRLLSVRVPELAAYQDWDYAERYVDGVRAVAAAEATRTPGHTELAEAVARNLYKLMAYKDEYEVSRLHLDAAIDDQIATVADGRDMAASINLHPPILRAMGMKNKMKFGPNTRPVLKTLASMKKLRGTKLDMFGYAKVRRTERELIEEYRSVVDRLVDGLTAENHDASVRIAGLPDLVRGYEEVKMGNVERYHDELQRALAELEANGS